MHYIVILLGIFAIVSCQNKQPMELDAHAHSSGMIAIGTLSSADDAIEAQASVIYTNLALYRFNAASMVRQGRMPVDTARSILRYSDDMRSDLDAAVEQRNTLLIQSVARRLDKAVKALGEL